MSFWYPEIEARGKRPRLQRCFYFKLFESSGIEPFLQAGHGSLWKGRKREGIITFVVVPPSSTCEFVMGFFGVRLYGNPPTHTRANFVLLLGATRFLSGSRG